MYFLESFPKNRLCYHETLLLAAPKVLKGISLGIGKLTAKLPRSLPNTVGATA